LSALPELSFATRVDNALGAKEIQRSLEHVPGTSDPKAAVAADVIARESAVLEETEAHRNARDKASERHAAVVEALRSVTRLSKVFAVVAIVAVAAAAIGGLVVLFSDSVDWSLGFSLSAGAGVGLFYAWVAAAVVRDGKAARLRLDARREERDAARARYETVLTDEITAEIRRSVNARLRSMATRFSILDERGLRELVDPEREVTTEATKQLRTVMSSLVGGSLGIAGPRGCGKTTLISRFATGRSVLPDLERRGLVVSAPVRYDAREFVLHLFARVCERVINPHGHTVERTRREELRAARLAGLGLALVVGAVLAAVSGGLMLATGRTIPHGPREMGIFLLCAAGLALEIGIIFLVAKQSGDSRVKRARARARARVAKGADDDESDAVDIRFKPERLAEQRLEEIRFQQTLASGWSADIGLPLGGKLSGDSKLTLSRTPWTLPEVVDEFRSYLATLTGSHYLVIGIDELDKIDADEDAKRFLNDIKGVFGVRGCFYLVSVSEDAMSNFERRGMPFRDVFDSSFDAILRVRHLSLAESRELLEGRVTGLPVPYQCLCHVIAGGLPRDLVRVARELLHQHKRPAGPDDIGRLSRAVIGSELQGKIAAAEVAVRCTPGGDRDNLLAWVQGHDPLAPTTSALRERFDRLVTRGMGPAQAGEGPDAKLRGLALELMAFDYFAATVLEFFAQDEELLGAFLVDGESEPPDLSSRAVQALEQLACARQQFAMSPALAVADVAAFRDTTELTPWTLPAGLATEGRNGRVHTSGVPH
jgi:hypothetical protein